MVAPLIGLYSLTDGRAVRTALPLLAYAGGAKVDESVPLLTVITLPPELRPGR